jgi:hypothetical protein
LRRASAVETRFDLRVPFAVERRLLPAQVLVGLVGAASAAAVGAPAVVWGWLALFVANSAARFLIATTYGDAQRPIAAGERCANQYLACAVADVPLWAGLLGSVPNAPAFVAGPGGFATAGAVLLAALTFGGWPRVWTFYVAAWVAIYAGVAVRTSGALTSFAFAFPLWLLAVWWLGRQQPLSRHARRGTQNLIKPTKFGWRAAIRAMPTPVIVAARYHPVNGPRANLSAAASDRSSALPLPVPDRDPPEPLQPSGTARVECRG